ncbi:hypothetical protein L4C33_13465 [Vibrio makurazakiensis]|uniref:hypothetical protein n=1 Tax=Vibrio makurazakiensis TaxID=2910250 RepID=UPI003D10FB9F
MKRKFLALWLTAILSGCSLFVSESSFGESWSGSHVNDLIAQWGEPELKKINEKNELEIEYKIFNDSCTYTFFTDSQGVIRSYKYESTFLGTCKPIG